MKYRKNIKKQIILSVFLLVLIAVGLVAFLMPRSFSNFIVIENVWSGNVATSFDGGNGTKENPYIISNGEELAYLKSVLEGKDYDFYKDQYYILSNDINMGGNEFGPIGNENNIFMGHIDGNGHTLSNFKVTSMVSNANNYYSGLFSILSNASVENLNIINSTINVSNVNNSYIGLLAGNMNNSVIKNVSIYDNTIEIDSTSNKYMIGGLSGSITKSNISYMYLDNDIKGEIEGYNLADLDDESSVLNVYINGNKEKISNKDIKLNDKSDFLDVLNKNKTDDYFWEVKENDYLLVRNENKLIFKQRELLKANSKIELHNSGIENGIVYVNDLEADYNYYMGLNYTYSSDYSLPSLENKNIYNDSNLVKMQITYNGSSSQNGSVLTGTVSIDERESKYIYYKTFEINNNGTDNNFNDDYIELELIDNPFTNRPNDKGFNGWRTNYPNVTLRHDTGLYTRYAKIPITYTDGKPNDIVIEFDAIWTDATVTSPTSNNITTPINNLLNAAMHDLKIKEKYTEIIEKYAYNYSEIPMNDYYGKYTIAKGAYYPSGAINMYGNNAYGKCSGANYCNYYLRESGYSYSEGREYYTRRGNNFTRVYFTLPYLLGTEEIERERMLFTEDDNMSTFFELITVPRNASVVGYYDVNGKRVTSGTCTSYSRCEYYKLIQYYDEYGNENKFDENKEYYYLVTRDTNIIVLNRNVSASWAESQTKPLTITSEYNGTKYNTTWTLEGYYLRASNDLGIENLIISINRSRNTSVTVPSSTTAGNFFGFNNNVKIGRGIKKSSDTQVNFQTVLGGSTSNTGTSNSIVSYRLIVESGYYNATVLAGSGASRTYYVNAEAIYGNDYDRVNNNNNNLDVYSRTTGTYTSSTIRNTSIRTIGLHTTVKSGSFGSCGSVSNNSSYSNGIYVGSFGSKTYTVSEAIIEGGFIHSLVGNAGSVKDGQNYNNIYIYMKGGNIRTAVGGAGRLTGYGNRILQITGGKVDYSILGGGNGIKSDSDATAEVNGSSYVYVGGNAQIGDETLYLNNSKIYGIEVGSVFGAGNGIDGQTYGSVGNSNIIIDGNAHILRNVYGGGNYATVGLADYETNTSTNIKLLNGTIDGSVFGAGNRNGSGSPEIDNSSWWETIIIPAVDSTINIDLLGSTVRNSIYGGANERGTVYGTVNINAYSGTVNNIYGGGYGGYTDYSNSGTYVRDNIKIKIGKSDIEDIPTINDSVYGGSAFGTVNGTSNNGATSTNGISIEVNKGVIKKSVFGGGEGDNTKTPNVYGPIGITINGGDIGSVYGANDYAGEPSSSINIYLEGGTIGDVFGGGHNVGMNTSTIYQKGSTVRNSIFGGSDQEGNVTKSKIIVTGGTTGNIYGGNNEGGKTTSANIEVSGGIIKKAIYGGGNVATTGITEVILNGGSAQEIYGGGANADVEQSTKIINNGIGYHKENDEDTNTGVKIFGGSNAGGEIPISYITNSSDIYVHEIYGGNNVDGLTKESKITMEKGNVGNIYGGGNKIGVTNSNIKLINGKVSNVYGGANQAGTVSKSNISTKERTKAKREVIDSTTDDFYISIDLEDTTRTPNTKELKVVLHNNLSVNIVSWDVEIESIDSEVAYNDSSSSVTKNGNVFSFDEKNKWWGTNRISANSSYSMVFGLKSNVDGQDIELNRYSLIGYDSAGNSYKYTVTMEEYYIEEEDKDLTVGNVYGGNNLGGSTEDASITLEYGEYNNIFGGGNQAITTGSTSVKGTNIDVKESIYGGGNDASVNGNPYVYIGGNTTIGKSVFGGGNHGAIGSPTNDNALAKVNIVGAKIGNNVYGGCNTSTVYGETFVNIGTSTVGLTSLPDIGDISIGNTIFGGGESNEAGSDKYDFTAISVTKGITVKIDGTSYEDKIFNISGSIFGSGNASSSAGPSNIMIRKLGTKNKPNTAISIQRTDMLTVDNSVIELTGTTDRTDEYHPENLFSLNRIKCMKVKNNTNLLLNENANMLERFESLVDINGVETKAEVKIDKENNTIERNVDNRLYMKVNKALNVALDQNVETYGVVYGMTFLGMYQKYSNGAFVYGMYDSKFNSGDEANEGDVLNGNTSVVGLHALNHDITIDGFYTNYIDEDFTVLTTEYIDPTPPDSNYYIWAIGTQAINYSIRLTASKYSSLGTRSLTMLNDKLTTGNTTFVITAVNADGLSEGVVLKDSNFVPKLASSQEEANSVMGISLKTETSEWTNHGTTKFISDNNSSYFTGDSTYITDNQTLAPNVMFYLYHAKNIASNLELGTIVISMQAIVPRNDLEYDTYRINIEVSISTKEYDDETAYDASITYSKKYEMPSATSVNITNRSQFTAYYSVLANASKLSDFYGKDNDYYHTLVSNYALPVGTKITMIDYGYDDMNPNYYYLIIDNERYQRSLDMLAKDNEVTYRLNEFIKMDSVSNTNTYNDRESNEKYFHENIDIVMEEFIFIFDFKDTTNDEAKLNNEMLFELRNSEDRTEVTILGIRQEFMNYNIYKEGNSVLTADISIDDEYVYYDTKKNISNDIKITYDQTDQRKAIIDTNYEDSNLGINVTLYDAQGNQVSSSSLSSSTISINNVPAYVDSNGVFRVKLADKVSNLNRSVTFTTGPSLPVGKYKMRIELFASNDGLHNNGDVPVVKELDITVVGNDNMIIATIDDEEKVIDGDTGLNVKGTNQLNVDLKYSSVLSRPNIRLSVYKRDVDNSMTINYSVFNARDLFINNLNLPSNGLISQNNFEFMLDTNPKELTKYKYTLRDNLISGTYKVVFRLYDGNQLIDEDYKYIIIKKKVSS